MLANFIVVTLGVVILVWVQLQVHEGSYALATHCLVLDLGLATEPRKNQDGDHEDSHVANDWIDVVHQGLKAGKGNSETSQAADDEDDRVALLMAGRQALTQRARTCRWRY